MGDAAPVLVAEAAVLDAFVELAEEDPLEVLEALEA